MISKTSMGFGLIIFGLCIIFQYVPQYVVVTITPNVPQYVVVTITPIDYNSFWVIIISSVIGASIGTILAEAGERRTVGKVKEGNPQL